MTNWLDENKPKIDELIKQGKSSREIAKVLGIRPYYGGISRDARFVELRQYMNPNVPSTPEQWLESNKSQITKLWENGESKSRIVDEICLVAKISIPKAKAQVIIGKYLNQLKKQNKVPEKPTKKVTLRDLFNQAKKTS